MKKEKIIQILNSHKEYLKGTGGCRADLSYVNLRGAHLMGANLSDADLSYANLSDADLSCAHLSGTHLIGTNLIGANLRGADLMGAELRGADLSGANLSGANLRGADLMGADLRGADLRGSDLIGANIDYSCLPLWCGSLSAKFDDKQIKQFIYHVVKAGLSSPNVSDRIKSELEKLIPLANEFHKANECGIIEYKSP